MNHINKLSIQVLGFEEFSRVISEGISELKSYLTSPKFYGDPTVQVADVLRRLGELESTAYSAQANRTNDLYFLEREKEVARLQKPKFNCERCDYFGKDWEDVALMGYTARLCRKCETASRMSGEVV